MNNRRNRLENSFNNKGFVPFITAGYPSLESTKDIILNLAANGASAIEIGIPFSDPTAEGPVIQYASKIALKNGTTTDKIFAMVEDLRKVTNIPLLFMTYANVVFSYGTDRFLRKCEEFEIDGLILPDVPFEEKKEFSDVCKKYKVDFISLIAPTSKDRIEMIAKDSSGFIYLVSSLGVTGTRNEITTDLNSIIDIIKAVTDTPVAVGFGISNVHQASEISSKADGIIVGSALIKKIIEHEDLYLDEITKLTKEFVAAIR